MSMFRLFARGEPADGTAPALEALAVDDNLKQLNQPAGPATRRDRLADAGDDLVAEALGTKLLHGWLQNRHQTLMPLSLNLAIMSTAQKQGLSRILASLLVAGRPQSDVPAAVPGLRTWLAGLGAEANTLAVFDQALEAPMPLNVMFETAQADELTVYAYVAALMASDPRFAVSVMLCDVIQARFDLPSAMVRSANRRYRR